VPAATATSSAEHSATKSDSTTYAISKTLHRSVEPAGRVRRIAAAVLVDDAVEVSEQAGKRTTTRRKRTVDEMKEIEQLARAAIGVDAARGDVLAVENLSFQELPLEVPTPPTKSEHWRRLVEPWSWLLRYVALGALFLVVYALILRPVKKLAMTAFRELPGTAVQPASQPLPTSAVANALEPAGPENVEGQRATQLKKLLTDKVKAEPGAASRLVESWVPRQREPVDASRVFCGAPTKSANLASAAGCLLRFRRPGEDWGIPERQRSDPGQSAHADSCSGSVPDAETERGCSAGGIHYPVAGLAGLKQASQKHGFEKMPFHFTLQAVLHFRQSIEHQQELRLRTAKQQVARMQHLIEQMDLGRQELHSTRMKQMSAGMTAAEMRFGLQCDLELSRRRRELDQQLPRLQQLRANNNGNFCSRPGGRGKPLKVCAINNCACIRRKPCGVNSEVRTICFSCGGNTCAVAKVCRVCGHTLPTAQLSESPLLLRQNMDSLEFTAFGGTPQFVRSGRGCGDPTA
jgi:hypothetical protein